MDRRIDTPLDRVERVPDPELAWIHQTNDITWIRALDRFSLAPEESIRPRRADLTSLPRVGQDHVLLEDARADAHKGDAIAMAAIHVRLDLEHESAERRRIGRDRAVGALPWGGGGRQVGQGLQEGLETEARERAAEKDRRVTPSQVGLFVECSTGAHHQRGLVDQ